MAGRLLAGTGWRPLTQAPFAAPRPCRATHEGGHLSLAAQAVISSAARNRLGLRRIWEPKRPHEVQDLAGDADNKGARFRPTGELAASGLTPPDRG